MAHKKQFKKVPVEIAQQIIDYLTLKPHKWLEVNDMIVGLMQAEQVVEIVAGDAPKPAQPESPKPATDTAPAASTPEPARETQPA